MTHMTRLLWLSRHGPAKAQLDDLKRIFGEVALVKRSITVERAEDVIELMRQEKCSEVVVVLPLTCLAELVGGGVYPLLAVLDKRRGRHSHFVRLKRLHVELERLEAMNSA